MPNNILRMVFDRSTDESIPIMKKTRFILIRLHSTVW